MAMMANLNIMLNPNVSAVRNDSVLAPDIQPWRICPSRVADFRAGSVCAEAPRILNEEGRNSRA